MPKKTAGVRELVQDVLETLPEPYGEDIIEDVCLAIERTPRWRRRYNELAEDLRDWVVNNWIGQYTKELTSLRTLREVDAKRSKIITVHKTYTIVRYERTANPAIALYPKSIGTSCLAEHARTPNTCPPIPPPSRIFWRVWFALAK